MLRSCSLLTLLLAVGWLPAAEEAPMPQLAALVARHLKADYYDIGRVQPQVMLDEALRALESSRVAIDGSQHDGVIDLQLGNEHVQVEHGPLQDLASTMQVLQRLQLAIQASTAFTPEVRSQLVWTMINGALATLDPHTVVMPPEPAKDFSEEVIAGEFHGIGAYLSSQEGAIRIDRVMPGLPADVAGLRDGDIILAVDGETTAGLTLPEAVRRIKGPRGSTVTLRLEREGQDAPLTIGVVRDTVTPPFQRSWRRGGIGYLRMEEFNGKTYNDVRELLHGLRFGGEEPLRGLVLDLRFNGGGRLDQARMIADLFLDGGKEIVRTVRLGAKPDIVRASRLRMWEGPLVVLVSPSSASAAEILAGSLQANDRAMVFGQPSFGKGSVQTWRQLPDDSYLKYTIQEYQLRDGLPIQGRGVVPDLALDRRIQRADGRIDLIPFSRTREADADFALTSLAGPLPAISSTLRLGWLQSHEADENVLRRRSIAHPDFVPDPEAMLAIDILDQALSGVPEGFQAERNDVLQRVRTVLPSFVEREDQRLGAALASQKQSVNWQNAQGDPQQLSVDTVGELRAKAGSTWDLTLRVRNAGPTDIGRLIAVAETDRGSPFWENEAAVGLVPAGAETTVTIPLRIPPRVASGSEHFRVALRHDGSDQDLQTLPLAIAIEGLPRPHLNYAWRLEDNNHDGKISEDEPVTLQLTLRNDGAGESAPLRLFAGKDNNPFLHLGAARWKLEPLAAGAQQTVEIPFTVQSQLTVGTSTRKHEARSVRILLQAEERFDEEDGGWGGESLGYTLELPLEQAITGAVVQQPMIEVSEQRVDDQGVLHVSWTLNDDNPRWLAILVGDDKRILRACDPAQAVQSGNEELALASGMNEVRLVAEDADSLVQVLALRLWSENGTSAAPTRLARPERGEVLEGMP